MNAQSSLRALLLVSLISVNAVARDIETGGAYEPDEASSTEKPKQELSLSGECNYELNSIPEEERALAQKILGTIFLHATGKAEISAIDRMNDEIAATFNVDMSGFQDIHENKTIGEIRNLIGVQKDAAEVLDGLAQLQKNVQNMEPGSRTFMQKVSNNVLLPMLSIVPPLKRKFEDKIANSMTPESVTRDFRAGLDEMLENAKRTFDAIPAVIEEAKAKNGKIRSTTRVMQLVMAQYKNRITETNPNPDQMKIHHSVLDMMANQIILAQDAEAHNGNNMTMLQILQLETKAAVVNASSKGRQSINQINTSMSLMIANKKVEQINTFTKDVSILADKTRALSIKSTEELQKSNLAVQKQIAASAKAMEKDAEAVAKLVEGVKNGGVAPLAQKEETIRVLEKTLHRQEQTNKALESRSEAEKNLSNAALGDGTITP